MGQAWFCTLPPACVFVFCLHRHSLPPARVLCFARRTSEHTASYTALRALTDPASLSKDASVSNEHLQEIAREAHVSSLFDGRSDSDSECAQPHSVLFSAYSLLLLCLCPVFCLLNSLPPACVFVFCLLRRSAFRIVQPSRRVNVTGMTFQPHSYTRRHSGTKSRRTMSSTAYEPSRCALDNGR